MNTDIAKQMEMVLYRTEDDNVTVSALIKDETIWLNCLVSQHGAMQDKTQTIPTNYYNLDAIISVGYRVNSIQATRFRIWARIIWA